MTHSPGKALAARTVAQRAADADSTAEAIIRSAALGLDSLQWRYVGYGGGLPMIVLTQRESTTRTAADGPLGACLPVEVRDGWHDKSCECDRSWRLINCAARPKPRPS